MPAAPTASGLAGALDGGLLDVSDGSLQFVGVLSTDRDESGGAEDAVASGEIGLLLEHVVELGTLLCVFDLADPLALGGVGDVLGLLLADVARGLVGAHRRVPRLNFGP